VKVTAKIAPGWTPLASSRDPRGNDARFPGTRTRQNQQRPVFVLNRRPLLWIESQGCPK